MSLRISSLILGLTLSGAAFGKETPDLSLEPCINGQVSATGSHATQLQEDQALINVRTVAKQAD